MPLWSRYHHGRSSGVTSRDQAAQLLMVDESFVVVVKACHIQHEQCGCLLHFRWQIVDPCLWLGNSFWHCLCAHYPNKSQATSREHLGSCFRQSAQFFNPLNAAWEPG